VNPGNWVFTASGSAARYAADSFEVLTDLTVCGIIDDWPPEEDTQVSADASASA
jgi:microcompartment protein CcmK/EutM